MALYGIEVSEHEYDVTVPIGMYETPDEASSYITRALNNFNAPRLVFFKHPGGKVYGYEVSPEYTEEDYANDENGENSDMQFTVREI